MLEILTFKYGVDYIFIHKTIIVSCCNWNVTLSPVEYLTVQYTTFRKFEKTIITVNWDNSNNWKAPIWGESFWRVSRFASLF